MSATSTSCAGDVFGGGGGSGGGGSGGGGGGTSMFYSPYLFGSGEKSTLRAFADHVFDTSFQGRKELMNTLQYCMVAAVLLMPFLAMIDSIVPEVNFHTHSGLMLFEIGMHLLLLMLTFLLVHRVTTFIPTMSGVQYSPVTLTAGIIPFLIVMFCIHTKLSAKASIVGDRLRHYWHMRPRRQPNHTARPWPSSSSGSVPITGTTPGQIMSAGGGGGSSAAPPATVPVASLPLFGGGGGGGSGGGGGGGSGFSPIPASAVLGAGW